MRNFFALTLLLLTTTLISPLVAQQPVVTLSASTFYRGDAPGSYTISCPAGTSAGVSGLTKTATVPLLDPASVQYGVGLVFPWPPASSPAPTLTGTLPQSYTSTVMGGKTIYNAGVLAGTAYCNNAVPTQTTTTAFTLTLNGTTSAEAPQVQARLTYALKAYSIKLPQLGTTEQNTLPAQQPGNLVYNTDQQKLALRTDTDWQYIGSNTGGYQNAAYFSTASGNKYVTTVAPAYALTATPANPVQTWTVPAGVTRFEVELWGGGAGGGYFSVGDAGNNYGCLGGGYAGGYARKTVSVVAGASVVSVVAGPYGRDNQKVAGTAMTQYLGSSEGGDSYVIYNGQTLRAGGGLVSAAQSGTDALSGPPALLVNGGAPGPMAVTYSQRSSTEFIKTVQCSNGGVGYGTPAERAGVGITVAFSSAFTNSFNGDQSFYKINGGTLSTTGSFPGGGGGCGYTYSDSGTTTNSSADGAPGLVIIRW